MKAILGIDPSLTSTGLSLLIYDGENLSLGVAGFPRKALMHTFEDTYEHCIVVRESIHKYLSLKVIPYVQGYPVGVVQEIPPPGATWSAGLWMFGTLLYGLLKETFGTLRVAQPNKIKTLYGKKEGMPLSSKRKKIEHVLFAKDIVRVNGLPDAIILNNDIADAVILSFWAAYQDGDIPIVLPDWVEKKRWES